MAASPWDGGGDHIMLMDLTGKLAPGDTVTLHLMFENAGPVDVQAPVDSGMATGMGAMPGMPGMSGN